MRYRMTWTGWTGAPGYTTFYADQGASAQQMATDCHQFMLTALTPVSATDILPSPIKINGDALVDEIEDSTGDQQTQIGVVPPAQIVGAGLLPWAGAAGACVSWNTPNFIKGRRLRGRTFFVPLSGEAFQVDGTLAQTFFAGLQAAAAAHINSQTGFLVWHRPTTKGGADGSSTLISAAVVHDKAAVLRSRRD